MLELRGITWDHVRGWGGLRAAADAYRDLRTDVRVTWETRSLQAFADQPVDELGGYDLIMLDHPSIGAAVERGSVVPLDEHLEPSFLDEQRASSVGSSFESYTWDEHQWALAVDAAAQVAAYRADLLEGVGVDVPRTWDDVIGASRALRRDGRWIAMPMIPVDAICAFLGIGAALGGHPFASDGGGVDREAGRQALAILRRVIDVAHPESLRWNPPRTLEHMRDRDDVAYCPLVFGYVTFARTSDRHALRFAPGPQMSGTLGGAGVAVWSSSRHITEASAFAGFAASPEIQRGAYLAGGGQPGHRAVWTDPTIDAMTNGFFSQTLSALDSAYLRPRHDGFLAFQDRAGELVHAFLRDGDDADDVLDRLDDVYRTAEAPW
jgi:multiple sugar transport system substrate-binding protein